MLPSRDPAWVIGSSLCDRDPSSPVLSGGCGLKARRTRIAGCTRRGDGRAAAGGRGAPQPRRRDPSAGPPFRTTTVVEIGADYTREPPAPEEPRLSRASSSRWG